MSKVQPWPEFIDGYNKERSTQIDNQRTSNMYIISDKESPEGAAFAMMPGLNYETRIGDDSETTRPLGLLTFEGSRYQVVGSGLYRNSNFINRLNTSTGIIHWASLETQVVIADNAQLYVYNITDFSFTPVVAPFIVNPGKITTFNQIVIVPLKGDNKWYASSINNATEYDGNRYIVFQLKPDTLMGAATINNRLLLFGQVHIECYIPQVTNSIPVVRDNNVVIDFGTWSEGSIVTTTEEQGAKFVCWLARDELGGAFFMLTEGTQGLKISTPAIDILLQTFDNLEDCYGFSYRIDGHLFIEWSFPTDGYTLVYDATVKKWTEREMLDGAHWIGNSHAYVNGIHYIGSRVDNSLYAMSSEYLTYYSAGNTQENIHRQRISPIIRNPAQVQHTISYFELKMESGTAPVNVNPEIFLQCSIDNNAFNNARSFSMPKMGQYGYKVYWYGLGTQYSTVIKIDMYDPIRTFIMGAAMIKEDGMR